MNDNLTKDIVYLLGAWERGADAEDYANEIATMYCQLLHQPEQDHGFDRTASHMMGGYVDTESPNDFDPDWDTVEPYLTYISELEEKLQGLSKIKELADYRLKLLTKMPSEWVGLTDGEINELEIDELDLPYMPTVKQFVRFIESKLKEKNT